jgi:hypothetical protein
MGEPGDSPGLADALMERFAKLGGVELELPPRDTYPRAVEFADADVTEPRRGPAPT